MLTYTSRAPALTPCMSPCVFHIWHCGLSPRRSPFGWRCTGKQALAIRQGDRRGVPDRLAAPRLMTLDGDVEADREVLLAPAAAIQGVGGGRLPRPVGGLPFGAGHVDIDPGV